MFHDFLISTLDEGGVIEITFSLLALLGQDVTMISVLSLQMAAAGYLETLLGSGLGLHFRHFTISFKVLKMSLFLRRFRSYHHLHALAFQLGHHLHFSELFQLLRKLQQHDLTLFLVDDGTASEKDFHLDL